MTRKAPWVPYKTRLQKSLGIRSAKKYLKNNFLYPSKITYDSLPFMIQPLKYLKVNNTYYIVRNFETKV